MSGRGVERLLDLLEWLADHPEPNSLGDIARELDAPKSSLLQMLRTLVDRSYLYRDDQGDYLVRRLPGQQSAANGERALTASLLLAISTPILTDAVQKTGESGFLAVLEDNMVRYLNKILPDVEIYYNRDIRPVRHPHLVASGIVMLSGKSTSELDLYAQAGGLNDADRQALDDKIVKAREQECWFNPIGVVEGAAGIAAPVYDSRNRIVAAVNISGPKGRMADKLEHIQDVCIATARRISEEIRRSI